MQRVCNRYGRCNFLVTHGEWCDKVTQDVKQDLKVNHSISVVAMACGDFESVLSR